MFISRVFALSKTVADSVNYTAFKEGAKLIYSNVPDIHNEGFVTDYISLVDFFTDMQNEYGKNSLGHMYVSCDDPSVNTVDIWNEITDRAIEELGLSHSHRIKGLHSDTETYHVHILMTLFRIEFCLGIKKYNQDEKFEKTPNKIFNQTYRNTKKELEKICIEIARKLENEFGIKEESLKVRIGRERYIPKEYSLKIHLKKAVMKAIFLSGSAEEYISNVKKFIEKEVSELIRRAANSGKKLFFMDGSLKPDVQVELKSAPKLKDYLVFKINNFKIRDFVLDKQFSFEKILKFLRNASPDVSSVNSGKASAGLNSSVTHSLQLKLSPYTQNNQNTNQSDSNNRKTVFRDEGAKSSINNAQVFLHQNNLFLYSMKVEQEWREREEELRRKKDREDFELRKQRDLLNNYQKDFSKEHMDQNDPKKKPGFGMFNTSGENVFNGQKKKRSGMGF